MDRVCHWRDRRTEPCQLTPYQKIQLSITPCQLTPLPMEKPVLTLAHLAMPFPDEMAESVPAYLADKPKGKFGPHRYEASRLGFDESTLRVDFASYIDHCGVALES